MVKGCWLDFGGLLVYGSSQKICKTLTTILFISDIPTRAPEYQYSHEGPLPRRHSDHQTSQIQGGLIRVPNFSWPFNLPPTYIPKVTINEGWCVPCC